MVVWEPVLECTIFVKWTKEAETESVLSEDAVKKYNDWPKKIIDQMAYKSDQ